MRRRLYRALRHHATGSIFTAYCNHAPLVITAGQQDRGLLPPNPFLGATEAAQFPKPYVKWSTEPARAEDVPAALAHAWHVAMQPPCGPTFVSIPMDDWPAPAEPLAPRRIGRDTGPDPELLQEAATALAASRNPVLVIGPEVDAAGAGPTAVALAERLGAPVLSSPFSGRTSFPKNHPLFAGFLAAAPNAVTASLAPHDLLLVLGAPVFTFHVAGDYSLPPVIQITADGEAIAAAPSGTGILGSLRLGLPALSALLPESRRPTPALRPRLPAAAEATPIPVEYLLQRLAAARPADSIIVEEAPSHRPAIQQHLPIPGWGGFFTMASGGLGYGLPAAVGVALARPGRRVIAVIGDGSMMYSIRAPGPPYASPCRSPSSC